LIPCISKNSAPNSLTLLLFFPSVRASSEIITI
jgi:hypothetical protein